MTAPTPFTKEEVEKLNALLGDCELGAISRSSKDSRIAGLIKTVWPSILATLAAETKRADEAEARHEHCNIGFIKQLDRATEAECQRDEAESYGKEVFATVETVLLRAQEAERQRDDLAARVVVLVDAVVDACASECKLRDEAKRIMSPDLERYAEAAHSLANLKARILAMTDGIAAAVALRERLEKAEQDARGERLVSHAFKVLLDSAQGRITALEATARTPGTVEVCERHALNDCEDYAGRHEKPKECPVFGCPIILSSAAKNTPPPAREGE